jgi:hypothetical protein
MSWVRTKHPLLSTYKPEFALKYGTANTKGANLVARGKQFAV